MAKGGPHITLNTGAKMPMVGLGTWQSKPGEVKAAVEEAIDAGYRHLDCAFIYGNENEIGDAIQAKIKEGVVKREDLFVTTKLWLTYFGRVRECIDKSLKLLKLEYVDLYLMHGPFALQAGDGSKLHPIGDDGNFLADESIHYTNVWKDMEKLQHAGLAKAIGISNFNSYQIEKLLKIATIVPAVHQYECHPYLGLDDMFKLCQSKGIVVTAHSPFGSPARPAAQPNDPKLLADPGIKKIGDKYGKENAQVIVRYMMQRGMVVIPKSVAPLRIRSNLNIFDFKLTDADMAEMKGKDCNRRMHHMLPATSLKYYPYKENYSE